MNYILQSGALTFGKYKGQGRLLMTKKHLFALADDPSAAMSLGIVMLDGIAGVMLGILLDSLGRRAILPGYLNDEDLGMLNRSVKRSLSGTVLLAKVPIGKDLVVRSTFAGFDFQSPEHGLLVWKPGLLHKGKMKKMLSQLDVPISA